MAVNGSDAGETQLGDAIQDLLVSSIRLSTGLTLYGIAQFQKVFDAAAGKTGLPGAAEKLGSTLEVLANSLESNMDETKREALRSVSRVSAKAIGKAFESLSPAAIRHDGGHNDAPAPASAGVSLAVDVLSQPPENL